MAENVLLIMARYESADHYIVSADIFLRKREKFVVKRADFFITQKQGYFVFIASSALCTPRRSFGKTGNIFCLSLYND